MPAMSPIVPHGDETLPPGYVLEGAGVNAGLKAVASENALDFVKYSKVVGSEATVKEAIAGKTIRNAEILQKKIKIDSILHSHRDLFCNNYISILLDLWRLL